MSTEKKKSDSDLTEELLCPVCLEFPEPPFSMCKVGHIVCSNCKPSIESCPVCRTPEFQPFRNVTLENIARKMLYPCEEQDSGCPERFTLDQRSKHRSECFYVPRKCPFAHISNEKCSWSGLPKDIKEHVKKDHEKKVDYTEVTGQFRMSLDNMSTSKHYCKAVFTLDELFYIVWATRDDDFYCAVMHIGPKANAKTYKYKIIITSSDDDEMISINLLTRNFMEDINKILEPGECASLHYRMVQKFMDSKNTLVVKMEINKCGEEKFAASVPTGACRPTSRPGGGRGSYVGTRIGNTATPAASGHGERNESSSVPKTGAHAQNPYPYGFFDNFGPHGRGGAEEFYKFFGPQARGGFQIPVLGYHPNLGPHGHGGSQAFESNKKVGPVGRGVGPRGRGGVEKESQKGGRKKSNSSGRNASSEKI